MNHNDSNRRQFMMTTVAAAAAVAAPSLALADDEWTPTKPIRIIVPFAPGVSPDVVARILGEPLQQVFHQPVIIDNRPGAAGIIGADAAAHSPPDGLTIFLTVNSIMGVNPNIYSKLPYDTFRDFIPVTQVVLVPYLLIVGPDQPYATLSDLIAKAKAKPGTIDYGSLGIGSGPHVVMEMMNNMAGIKMNHVPYKTSAVSDVMAGQIPMTFDPATTAVPLARTGKVRALAVTSKQRIPSMPDLPTVAELLPGYDGDGWQGIYVPTGTPKEAVSRYQKEVARILQRPDVKARLADLGLQPVGSTPEEFAVVSKVEVEKWGRIAKANNIRVD